MANQGRETDRDIRARRWEIPRRAFLWLNTSGHFLEVEMRRRHFVYLAVVVVAALVLYPLLQETIRQGGEIWHAAPFLGSMLIAIGWIVTSEANIRSSKRQNTIMLITQHLLDNNRTKNRTTIRKTLPTYETNFTPQMVSFDDEDHELIKALDIELNFYEFIAAAARRDDLDEKLLKVCLRGMFTHFHKQCSDYIKHWQTKNSDTWSQMDWMRRKWDKPGFRERICTMLRCSR